VFLAAPDATLFFVGRVMKFTPKLKTILSEDEKRIIEMVDYDWITLIYEHCIDCGACKMDDKVICPRCGSTNDGYIL
jgi:hypothetical protein